MTHIGDIIATGLTNGLNSTCPHCECGINWQDYNPELADKIAKEIEGYLKPQMLTILNTLKGITECYYSKQVENELGS